MARQTALGTPTLEMPTLMVWGTEDKALGVELTRGTERWVKDLTLRYVPDVGHFVLHEAPDEVNRILEAWLTGAPVPEAPGRRVLPPSGLTVSDRVDRLLLDRVAQALPAGACVLDLPTGDGALAGGLARQGFRVTPADRFPESFRGEGDPLCVDMNDPLPFPDERFDGVRVSGGDRAPREPGGLPARVRPRATQGRSRLDHDAELHGPLEPPRVLPHRHEELSRPASPTRRRRSGAAMATRSTTATPSPCPTSRSATCCAPAASTPSRCVASVAARRRPGCFRSCGRCRPGGSPAPGGAVPGRSAAASSRRRFATSSRNRRSPATSSRARRSSSRPAPRCRSGAIA